MEFEGDAAIDRVFTKEKPAIFLFRDGDKNGDYGVTFESGLSFPVNTSTEMMNSNVTDVETTDDGTDICRTLILK